MKLLKKSITTVLVLSISFPVFSQEPLRDFFQGGVGDAKTMTDAYLKPYGEMLGTSLNAGWYNTAKVHGVLGFDVTFSVMNAMAPSSMESFDVNNLDLQNFQLQDGSPSIAPTVAGEMAKDELPKLEPKVPGGDYAEFNMPNGSGNDNLPLPMIQAAVGLPYNTEIIGRVVPEMKFGDAGKVSVLGFGLKHSLKSHIPFVKRLPFLQMSVLAGYTNFKSTNGISGSDYVDVTDGELGIESGAFTSRLLVGANFPIVSVYTGVGYGSSNSDFDVRGSYSLADNNNITIPDDPFTLKYNTSGVDFNAGMRVRIGFLALHADYTVGDYSTLTAGIGVNIR